jgi:hypothetical protein
MIEFRLTCPRMYGPGTAGYFDASARQGYYIIAESAKQAKDILRDILNLSATEPLDVQFWDKWRMKGTSGE